MTRSPVRVSFRKFYPHFDPAKYFVPLLVAATSDPIRVVPFSEPADLEFVSVYEQHRSIPGRAAGFIAREFLKDGSTGWNEARPSHLARRSIWYSAENQRPPLADWDATWSFDADSDSTRNVYFPLWWFLFPELIGHEPVGPSPDDRLGRAVTIDECLAPRKGSAHEREGFVCAFVGNPEPTRMRALEALRDLGQVDIFGSSVGRPVTAKSEIAGRYRFVLCFENDIWPGYVTEKPFDAWACGAIPLWSGLDPEGYLNPDALVNMADLRTPERLVAQVGAIQSSSGLMERMSSEPILLRRPSLGRVVQSIREVLETSA